MRTQKSNPNYGRRVLSLRFTSLRGPRIPTGAEIAAMDAEHDRRLAEVKRKGRLSRKRMLEVKKYLPYIYRCEKEGKIPHRAPKRVLATVIGLRLVRARQSARRVK